MSDTATIKDIISAHPKYSKVENIFEDIKKNGHELKSMTKSEFEKEYLAQPLDCVE